MEITFFDWGKSGFCWTLAWLARMGGWSPISSMSRMWRTFETWVGESLLCWSPAACGLGDGVLCWSFRERVGWASQCLTGDTLFQYLFEECSFVWVRSAEVVGLPSGFDGLPGEQVGLAHVFVCCICTARVCKLEKPVALVWPLRCLAFHNTRRTLVSTAVCLDGWSKLLMQRFLRIELPLAV